MNLSCPCAYGFNNNDSKQYVSLIDFEKDYEILTTEPFTIRCKWDKSVITEKRSKDDFIKVYLDTPYGQVRVYKHYLIARQFVKNPFNFIKVIHIDGNKLNNSLNNLCWVGCSNYNKRQKIYKFDFINYSLNDITEIYEFNGVRYPKDTYYFCYDDDCVYVKIDKDKWIKNRQYYRGSYLSTELTDKNKRHHKILMNELIRYFRSKPDEKVSVKKEKY